MSENLKTTIATKVKLKLKAKRNSDQVVWFGLGVMGLIGWSVVIPTLLGAALGIWLDHRYPKSYSWTLTLLIVGLCFGCYNAWHWVDKEDKEMREEQDNNNE